MFFKFHISESVTTSLNLFLIEILSELAQFVQEQYKCIISQIGHEIHS